MDKYLAPQNGSLESTLSSPIYYELKRQEKLPELLAVLTRTALSNPTQTQKMEKRYPKRKLKQTVREEIMNLLYQFAAMRNGSLGKIASVKDHIDLLLDSRLAFLLPY